MIEEQTQQKINTKLHPPRVMGILNITPDSFYDGGTFTNKTTLINTLNEWNAIGVDMIDIGAESTRPGAMPVSVNEELSRLEFALPIVRAHSTAQLSVDTTKPECAEFALANGAAIINDVSGGNNDALLRHVAKANASIILMHKQGTPQTMQHAPSYTNVIDDIKNELQQRISLAQSFGITNIIIDPGIGFGKSLSHNLSILKHLHEFHSLGVPLAIGTSNKSFIGDITNAPVDQRLPGSLASALWAAQQGAAIIRVHNVIDTIQALQVMRAIHE